MIEILENLQSLYVPVQPKNNIGDDDLHNNSIQDRLFFGGDQLTEERSRNAQMARSDGVDDVERLEGLMPKVEDWHASRIVYQVSFQFHTKLRTLQLNE